MLYSTYFVTAPSITLPHGTFLKGQPVTLLDSNNTKSLIDSGLISKSYPLPAKPISKTSINIIDSSVVESTSEQVHSEVEVTETEVETTDEELDVLEAAPVPPVSKKRNGRRKRSTERSS